MRLWEVDMSDTPRTDAAESGCKLINKKHGYDFARQLEREITTIRQQLAEEREQHIAAVKLHAEFMNEVYAPMEKQLADMTAAKEEAERKLIKARHALGFLDDYSVARAALEDTK